MQGFKLPSIGDKFGSKIVEEFGMCGLAAKKPEVAGSIDNAGAEVMLPEAIGKHSGGKWIVSARDPFRQGQAALTFIGVGLEFIGFGDLIEDGETGGDDE